MEHRVARDPAQLARRLVHQRTVRRHRHIQPHHPLGPGSRGRPLEIRQRRIRPRHHDLLIGVDVGQIKRVARLRPRIELVQQRPHRRLPQPDDRSHPVPVGVGRAHQAASFGHQPDRVRKIDGLGDHRGRPGADGQPQYRVGRRAGCDQIARRRNTHHAQRNLNGPGIGQRGVRIKRMNVFANHLARLGQRIGHDFAGAQIGDHAGPLRALPGKGEHDAHGVQPARIAHGSVARYGP